MYRIKSIAFLFILILLFGCDDKVLRLNWESMRWIKIINCNSVEYILFEVQNAATSKIILTPADTFSIDNIKYKNVVFATLAEASVDFKLEDSTSRKGEIYKIGYRLGENDLRCPKLANIKKIKNVGVFANK